ncbi:uncharacterized [Tachysurus ichikawai]
MRYFCRLVSPCLTSPRPSPLRWSAVAHFFRRSVLPGLCRPTLPCPTSSANMPSLQRNRLPSAGSSLQPSP